MTLKMGGRLIHEVDLYTSKYGKLKRGTLNLLACSPRLSVIIILKTANSVGNLLEIFIGVRYQPMISLVCTLKCHILVKVK